jgi:hypothetical protein
MRAENSQEPVVLDIAEKTYELIAALKAAAPFPVVLTPEALATLAKGERARVLAPAQMVFSLSYLGDAGGILCHIKPDGAEDVIVISLTHVRVATNQPFAKAVLAYQKHRVKKLKKQGRS